MINENTSLSKRRLKMWIRLLGVTRAAESQLREYLRVTHDTTLPRFDVMAALYRRGEAVKMSDLSRMLLVSNGNSTAVVDRLEKDGLVQRLPSDQDRRSIFVKLTNEGVRQFEILASDHEREVDQFFGSLDQAAIDALTSSIKRVNLGTRP